ncbi:MAG TPA: hypothetical protein VHE55_18190 [Fimbriimonadaceae bacterium]|nr:hypothetical protein [Fimbriimonadaceae bacterium]
MMLAALIVVIAAQKGNMGDRRPEPPWNHFSSKAGLPELRAIRESIEKKYGRIPETSGSPAAEADAPMAAYLKSHSAADAFRAVYMILATRRGWEAHQFKLGVDPFKNLPVDDYEVVRLRFLWNWTFLDYQLGPLGDRLLARDPNDAEVLWADSFICSHYHNETKGVERAEKLVKLLPCVQSYLRAADAHAYMYLVTKKPEDGKLTVYWFDKYFAKAKKDDPDYAMSVKERAYFKKQGF